MSLLEDVDVIRQALVVTNLAPPVQPPEPHAVWTLAVTTAPPPPIEPLEQPGLRATVERITKVATTFRDFARLAGEMWPVALPSTYSAEAFPYVLALRLGLTLGVREPPVRVAVSAIAGRGVFATRDLKPNELVSTYPVHALRVFLDLEPVRNGFGSFVFFYRNAAHSDTHAECHWAKYKMVGFSGKLATKRDAAVCFYGDPNVHSPEACGHMINDPRGTGGGANCVVCPIAGGAVTAILVTKAVQAGEELLMNYGEAYWACDDTAMALGEGREP